MKFCGKPFSVGSKIIIHYDDSQRHQLRELKLSGGFLSFDPAIVHFGLAHFARIDQIDVQWSTGETTTYQGPFSSGKRYRITRPARSLH